MPATDEFRNLTAGLTAPLTRIEAVAPSDTTDLNVVTRALNVAQSGIVRVTTQSGDTGDIFIVAGVAFPVRVVRVWSTETTATGIVGLS